MNDFTKEELQDLHFCCYGSIHDDHPAEDWKLILQNKIQSMIDNYCEHEGYDSMGLVNYCYKCKYMWKIVNDNQ